MTVLLRRLRLFPVDATVDVIDAVSSTSTTTATTPVTTPTTSSVSIGGHCLSTLAAAHGTPLYVYSQRSADFAVNAYRNALKEYAGESNITYAAKAFLCLAVARWAAVRDLRVDCTGEGEIGVAVAAAVPRAQILVHGVNKSAADLASAVENAGVIVVDNLCELTSLALLFQHHTADAAAAATSGSGSVSGSGSGSASGSGSGSEIAPFPALWLRWCPVSSAVVVLYNACVYVCVSGVDLLF
jgi:hypothetical protein